MVFEKHNDWYGLCTVELGLSAGQVGAALLSGSFRGASASEMSRVLHLELLFNSLGQNLKIL